jgi:hypothetical protein
MPDYSVRGGGGLMLNAWKNGVSIVNEDIMNQTLVSQPFALIYAGSQRDAKTGAGVSENSIAGYSYCVRFTLTGATSIGRIELELDRDGTGADLVVQIRSNMVPGSGTDGTLRKEVVVPKEFIPDTKGYISIPINLTGLTVGNQYWIVVTRAGDATNKNDWIGEAAQDGSYPAYRRAGSSGSWTANNALHFRVYSNDPAEGRDDVMHSITGDNLVSTYEYDADGLVTKAYRYLPPADGAVGGVRSVLTFAVSGEYIMGGV